MSDVFTHTVWKKMVFGEDESILIKSRQIYSNAANYVVSHQKVSPEKSMYNV